MPTFEISAELFSRLQAYATPLVDSVETTLAKVLDLADAAAKGGAVPPPASLNRLQGVPDLSHTTLTGASIDGRSLLPAQCNWNAFMMAVIEKSAPLVPVGRELSDLLVVNHVAGRKEDNGYKYLEGVGLSVQGQNSNNAWKAISHLARATGIKAEASFYWSNNPKAARPGETGHLVA